MNFPPRPAMVFRAKEDAEDANDAAELQLIAVEASDRGAGGAEWALQLRPRRAWRCECECEWEHEWEWEGHTIRYTRSAKEASARVEQAAHEGGLQEDLL